MTYGHCVVLCLNTQSKDNIWALTHCQYAVVQHRPASPPCSLAWLPALSCPEQWPVSLNARSVPPATATSTSERERAGEYNHPSSERRDDGSLLACKTGTRDEYVRSFIAPNRSSPHTYFAHVHPIFQSKWCVDVPKQRHRVHTQGELSMICIWCYWEDVT